MRNKVLSISTDRNIFRNESSVQARALNYAKFFPEYHQIVFSLKYNKLDKNKKIDNLYLYSTDSIFRFMYVFDSIWIASSLLRKNRTDWVITTQDPFETGLVGLILSIIYKTPLQVQVHTDFLSPYFTRGSFLNKIRYFLAKIVLPKSSRVRVVSRKIKNELIKNNLQSSEKIDILPVLLNKNTSPNILDEDFGMVYDFDKKILVVSRLEKEKNINLAINVFANLVRKYPNWGLIIVGSGSEMRELGLLVEKLNISKNVVFEGWKDNVGDYYKKVDILLNTSNYEGYGLILSEARLESLPVVSTDVGIARDLLGDDWVCPVNDRDCLISKIERLLVDKDSQNSPSKDLIEDDMSSYAEKYSNLLKNI